MLIKLAALGTLGYVSFKFLQSTKASIGARKRDTGEVRLAGGPLSPNATIQHTDEVPVQRLLPIQ